MVTNLVQVEVAYATPEKQTIIALTVESGSSIEKVIQASGMLTLFPEIDLTKQKVGIFSKQKKLTELVQAGDRVEIYRSLLLDPKENRRKRASS